MASIIPASGWWGEINVRRGLPSRHRVHNALYQPVALDETWGLFDASGKIVTASLDPRGPERVLSRQLTERQNPLSASEWGEKDEYVFIGYLHAHFGHFLINTLPRLWWAASDDNRDQRTLLCHTPATIQDLANLTFLQHIFCAMDLDITRVVKFDAPTRVACVDVPSVSLDEQFAIYPMLRDLCLMIAARLQPQPIRQRSEPLYLSKTSLASGVGFFEGEAAIEERARAKGFNIVYPETLSFPEQIKTLSEHRVIAGTVGSAFHTLLFCPPGRRVIGLNPINQVNSNFGLIDAVSGVEASYFAPAPGGIEHASGDRFLTTHKLRDPAGVARDFIAEVENANR